MRNEKGQFIKGHSGFTGEHTEEAKIKIRIARARQGSNVWNRGTNKSGMKGKHHTEEAKRKSSLSQFGSRNHMWKGGLTPYFKQVRRGIEWSLWRLKVFSRDNFTCQKCKIRGGSLVPHHILNFSSHEELRFEVANGITLCDDCHKIFHRKFGLFNNSLEQLNQYLYEKNC